MKQGELLSRGQASRNRFWAGLSARARTMIIVILACAMVGAWAGWKSASDFEKKKVTLYLKWQWDDIKNPFGRNLTTPEAQVRNLAHDIYFDPRSPLTVAFKAMLWRMLFGAGLFGLALGLPIYRWRRQAWLREGEAAGRPKTVRGGELISAPELKKLVAGKLPPQPVAIGGVPIPSADESRHFMLAGATGTGKTTAIWAMLDTIEARGEHAFVHDVDGSYVARYYRPERGDIILNPFDARCAYWNPFSDVRSDSDADRMAGFLVANPSGGNGGDDVWYNQARLAAAAIIKRLWQSGRGTLDELSRALRDLTPDELRELLAGTEASRVFQENAEKATASVLFCLAEAAKIVGTLKRSAKDGASISFDDFYQGLPAIIGPKPWIFLASRKRNFAAAKPLLGCWLDCAVASILDRPIANPPRAWLVLDELPALPRATGLLTLLPEGRKFGAAVMIAFQAIGQLRETYGVHASSTIIGQTATQLVMRLGDPESTKWATQLLGQSEIEEHRASQSLDSDVLSDKGSISTQRQTKAIVLDSEISQLPPLTGYLRLSGMPVAKVQIDRAHMARPDIAEGTVPLAASQPPASPAQASPAPPSPSPPSQPESWTDGGAL